MAMSRVEIIPKVLMKAKIIMEAIDITASAAYGRLTRTVETITTTIVTQRESIRAQEIVLTG